MESTSLSARPTVQVATKASQSATTSTPPTVPRALSPMPCCGASWPCTRSSGIGLATVQALAAQGLNVLLVAMPDALLTAATKELSEKYKAQVGEADVCETARPTPELPILCAWAPAICVSVSYQSKAVRHWPPVFVQPAASTQTRMQHTFHTYPAPSPSPLTPAPHPLLVSHRSSSQCR